MKKVRIEYDDISFSMNEGIKEASVIPFKCEGYVLEEDERQVKLTFVVPISPIEDWDDYEILCIPRGCITKYQVNDYESE